MMIHVPLSFVRQAALLVADLTDRVEADRSLPKRGEGFAIKTAKSLGKAKEGYDGSKIDQTTAFMAQLQWHEAEIPSQNACHQEIWPQARQAYAIAMEGQITYEGPQLSLNLII